MKKHPTPLLDKDSATESKACDLAEFLDTEKETLHEACYDGRTAMNDVMTTKIESHGFIYTVFPFL